MKLDVPLDQPLADEIYAFWGWIFESEHDFPPDVFTGSEREFVRYRIYVERIDGRIASTCNLIWSDSDPRVAGLGEVATHPEFRRRGLAGDVCAQALEDFRGAGGEAVYLGTNNPGALRVYHRLGWRRLAGTAIMAAASNGNAPEEFMADYFRAPGRVAMRPADPAIRATIVPLLCTAHDWRVLDANMGMHSIRYEIQGSCNGLYRRCSDVTNDERGQWFVAATEDGRAVGLSSARLDDDGRCRVDGFAHWRFMDSMSDLLDAAVAWGRDRGAGSFAARLCVEDEDKIRRFDDLGFRSGPPGDDFEIDGRTVASVMYERA